MASPGEISRENLAGSRGILLIQPFTCELGADLGHQFDQQLARAEPVTGTTSQTHRTFHCATH